jgi:hypothetical protein
MTSNAAAAAEGAPEGDVNPDGERVMEADTVRETVAEPDAHTEPEAVTEAVVEPDVVAVPEAVTEAVEEPVLVAVPEPVAVELRVAALLPLTVAVPDAVPVAEAQMVTELVVEEQTDAERDPLCVPDVLVQRLPMGEAEGDKVADLVAGLEVGTDERVAGRGVALPHGEGVRDWEGEPDWLGVAGSERLPDAQPLPEREALSVPDVVGQRLPVGVTEGDGVEDLVAGLEVGMVERVAGRGVALPHGEGVRE